MTDPSNARHNPPDRTHQRQDVPDVDRQFSDRGMVLVQAAELDGFAAKAEFIARHVPQHPELCLDLSRMHSANDMPDIALAWAKRGASLGIYSCHKETVTLLRRLDAGATEIVEAARDGIRAGHDLMYLTIIEVHCLAGEPRDARRVFREALRSRLASPATKQVVPLHLARQSARAVQRHPTLRKPFEKLAQEALEEVPGPYRNLVPEIQSELEAVIAEMAPAAGSGRRGAAVRSHDAIGLATPA